MFPIGTDKPLIGRPVVTTALVVLCFAVFIWQLSLGQAGGRRAELGLGLIPAVFWGRVLLPEQFYFVPPGLTLFTAQFLHSSSWHLLTNTLFLWIFGKNVEDVMGAGRFLIFFMVCGLIANFLHALFYPGLMLPMVGASGAISGILGAYILLFPYTRILTVVPLGPLLTPFRVPIVWFLGVWIGLQIVKSFLTPIEVGGEAIAAHIGGLVAGALLIRFFTDHPLVLLRSWSKAKPQTPDKTE